MNSLKLQLENFQSITSGTLEFVTGLNFIIGQSNSGKSATFRALKTCLSNPSGSQRYIKRGYPNSSVALAYNGNVVIWKRTSKESSYIINGELYVKTGSSSAFKILKDETGFIQGDNGVIMNIEEELQLPFPFGYNKSELFKLYENVFCVSDSAVILKSAKEFEGKVKFDLDMLEVDLNKNKMKLQELAIFKQEVNLDKLKEALARYKKAEDRLNTLREGNDIIKLAVKASKIDLNITSFSIKDKVPVYNELIYLKTLVNKVKQYHRLEKELPTSPVMSLEKLVLLKDKKELKALASQLQALSNIRIEEKEFMDKLASFKEKQELKQIIIQLEELCGIQLKVVEFKNKLVKYNELVKYKADLKTIFSKGIAKKRELVECQELLKHIQERLSEYKVCPLCHRPLE